MWAEIVGAGATLLGGLFGKKKQKTETTVNYQKMVESATAAGFNPLTAIRNGGSAGFTTTTSPTVSMLPEALGNLGGVLGSALDKKLDPISARKREPDTALLSYQLQQHAKQNTGMFAPRALTTGTKVSRQLVPRLGEQSHKTVASVPAAFKSDMGYEQGDTPKVTNPYPKGYYPEPNTPDADVIETRLGDDIFSPGFWWVGSSDLNHNVASKLGIPPTPYGVGARLRDRLIRSRERERKSIMDTYVPPKRLGGWASRYLRPASSGGW